MPATIPHDQAIFEAARRILDPAARAAFVREQCAGNSDAQRRILPLLAAYDDSASFLESPAVAPLLETENLGEAVPLGAQIGPYKLREVLGEGGMGIVYAAEQEHPVRRKVALKVIKPGMDTREVIARLEAERQALALMDHPNIAKLLDAGTTGGGDRNQELGIRENQADSSLIPNSYLLAPDAVRPYFVMELVRGLPITDYCDQAKLSLRERLKLFVTVCQAVQHAHQKGIIHRDIKPSNVMITLHDGVPVPKVIDFGVAKALNQRLTEHTLYTRNAQLLGTPLYMSPEQAELSGLDVDTRSDVYSLGVLLYELLTGQTPFDKETLNNAGLDELRRMIREVEPSRPSQRISTLGQQHLSTVASRRGIDDRHFARTLRGELDWIVMKALEKDRARRYGSVEAFAADLQRFLDDEPVQALPPSAMYRLRKLVRRQKALVSTGALLLAFVLTFTVLLWTERSQTFAALARESHARETATEQRKIAEDRAHRAQEQEQQARKSAAEALHQRDRAVQNQYYAEIASGQTDSERGHLQRLHHKLIQHLPLVEENDRRGWEWYYLFSQCHPEVRTWYSTGYTPFASWSPDGELIAAVGAIWRAETGESVQWIDPCYNRRSRGAWSLDGQMYAWGTCGDDNCIYLWNRQTNALTELRGHEGSVWCVAWSPDGKQLASGGMDNSVWIWDVASGLTVQKLDASHHLTDVEWSPNGALLAGAVLSGSIRVWQPNTGEVLTEQSFSNDVFANRLQLSWHPSGHLLAVSAATNWSLLSTTDWKITRQQATQNGRGSDIAWRPDGQRLAVADGDAIDIWDPAATAAERTLRGHLRPVSAVAWSPNGSRLVSSDIWEEIKLWEVDRPSQPEVQSWGVPIVSLSWSPDSQRVRTVTEDAQTSLSTSGTSSPENVEPANVIRDEHTLPSPDGRFFAIYRDDAPGETRILASDNGALQAICRSESPDGNSRLAWSRDGDFLAIAKKSKTHTSVELWDVDDERLMSTWRKTGPSSGSGSPLAWSPDGTRVAIADSGEAGDGGLVGWHGHVYIVHVGTAATIRKYDLGGVSYQGHARCLAWNAAGDAVVAGTDDGVIQVMKAESEEIPFLTRLESTSVHSVDWSPDGRRIACATQDGSVKILAAVDGTDLLNFFLPDEPRHVKWSPDGQRLAAATAGGNVHVWDASRAYEFTNKRARIGELAWTYFRASSGPGNMEEQRKWDSVLQTAPDRPDFWDLRGQARARLGDFDGASEEYAKAVAHGLARSFPAAHEYGYALLGAGRYREFSRHCASMLAEFKDAPVPSSGRKVAWLCTLSSDDAIDRQAVMDLARKGRESDEPLSVMYGAALYRSREYEEATEVLKYIADSDATRRSDAATALYFLAMARHRLGHVLQAQRCLDEAASLTDQLQSTTNWQEKAQTKSLDQEARSMISDQTDRHTQ